MYDNLCIISFKGLTEDGVLEALINGEVDAEIEVEGEEVTLYGLIVCNIKDKMHKFFKSLV